ncbi:RS10B protein, partial [Orthonyx spaldingii]|nr:RS10B protein [Orthonyx spaldingii]
TPGESKDDVSFPNEDVKQEQDSCPENELTDEAKEDKDEQEEQFSLWMCQVEIFFTTKFFPAYEHEIVLKEEIKGRKKQDAELAGLRKIQAEELARLIAEKEVEEAGRREAAAAEKALALQRAELEESARRMKDKAGRRGALSKKVLTPKRGLSVSKEAPRGESSPKQ